MENSDLNEVVNETNEVTQTEIGVSTSRVDNFRILFTRVSFRVAKCQRKRMLCMRPRIN